MASISRLFGDTKYADGIINCDGKCLYYHRAIVCSRSHVLAVEFDDEWQASFLKQCSMIMMLTPQQATDGKPIWYTKFDYFTLERMLQFIYEGNYEVDTASLQNGTANNADAASINGHDGERIPPQPQQSPGCDRALSGSPIQMSSGTLPSQSAKTPITNVMTAHALVYAAGQHYELPDLKALSIRKFKESKERLDISEFLNLAKVVYHYTTATEDPLRKAFVKKMLADEDGWLSWQHSCTALLNATGLPEFAVAVIVLLIERSANRTDKDKSATEAQASGTKMLLSTIDQINEALAKSSERIKALEAELAAAKSVNKELLTKTTGSISELQNGASMIGLLQSDLKKANVERVRAESSVKALQSEISKLEKDAKASKDLIKQHMVKAEAAQADLTATKEALKKEAARADAKSDQSWKKALHKETRRASEYQELCNEKDKIIKDEMLRADKGRWIIRSISAMVNKTCECWHCGLRLDWTLVPDDRIDPQPPKEQPKNLLLRCYNCSTKVYGKLIT